MADSIAKCSVVLENIHLYNENMEKDDEFCQLDKNNIVFGNWDPSRVTFENGKIFLTEVKPEPIKPKKKRRTKRRPRFVPVKRLFKWPTLPPKKIEIPAVPIKKCKVHITKCEVKESVKEKETDLNEFMIECLRPTVKNGVEDDVDFILPSNFDDCYGNFYPVRPRPQPKVYSNKRARWTVDCLGYLIRNINYDPNAPKVPFDPETCIENIMNRPDFVPPPEDPQQFMKTHFSYDPALFQLKVTDGSMPRPIKLKRKQTQHPITSILARRRGKLCPDQMATVFTIVIDDD